MSVHVLTNRIQKNNLQIGVGKLCSKLAERGIAHTVVIIVTDNRSRRLKIHTCASGKVPRTYGRSVYTLVICHWKSQRRAQLVDEQLGKQRKAVGTFVHPPFSADQTPALFKASGIRQLRRMCHRRLVLRITVQQGDL